MGKLHVIVRLLLKLLASDACIQRAPGRKYTMIGGAYSGTRTVTSLIFNRSETITILKCFFHMNNGNFFINFFLDSGQLSSFSGVYNSIF